MNTTENTDKPECNCVPGMTLEQTDDLMIQLNNLNNASLDEKLPNPFELTTDVDDNKLKEINELQKFNDSLEGYHNLIKSVTGKDRETLIVEFWSKIPDHIWNSILENEFRTVTSKNLNLLAKQHNVLIDYKIGKDKCTHLSEVKYKTSVCEKTKAWSINEDIDFSMDKPELMALVGYNLYSVKARIQEEYIQVPYITIAGGIKTISNKYGGFLEYVYMHSDTSKISKSNGNKVHPRFVKASELDLFPEVIFGMLRYRNHKVHGNSIAWNTIVKNRVVTKDIGYFTFSDNAKFLGNVWIDEHYRGKGIGKAMMDYIAKNILPKAGFIYVESKTPEMLKLIEGMEKFDYDADAFKISTNKIAKALPYQFDNNPNRKGLDYYLENLYVIEWKQNEEWIHDLKQGRMMETSKGLLFTEDFFPSMLNDDIRKLSKDNKYPTMYDLYNITRSYFADNTNINRAIKIIGYTTDKEAIPAYYNYYTDQEDYLKHLVYAYEDEIYLYPLYDDKLHFGLPLLDCRTVSTKVDTEYCDNIKIYETDDEVIVNFKINNVLKSIVLDNDFNAINIFTTPDDRGDLSLEEYEKSSLCSERKNKNFERVTILQFFLMGLYYGIENSLTLLFERDFAGGTKLHKELYDQSELKDYRPVSFNYDTTEIKFESSCGSITTTKTLKELTDILLG